MKTEKPGEVGHGVLSRGPLSFLHFSVHYFLFFKKLVQMVINIGITWYLCCLLFF